MAKRYDKEIEEKIVDAYNSGLSAYKIVEAIPELYGKRPSVIYGVLKRLGIQVRRPTIVTDEQKIKRRKFHVQDDFFSVINTEEKAYWLGFIYADGYIKTNADVIGISLAEADINHLETFKQSIKFTGKVKKYVETQGYNAGATYARIIVTSKQMKNDLIKLGVKEKKTNILTFPTEDQVSPHLLNHFLRGYFDGDGCLTHLNQRKSGIWEWALKIIGTREMLEGFQNFFGKHIKLYQRFPERNVNNYSLEYGGNQQVKKFMDMLYANATIYLNRKFQKYKQLLSSMVDATENHGL